MKEEDIQYEDADVEEGGIEVEDDSAEPLAKIEKLKKALKAVQKEKEEYLAGWQRSRADFINARKEEEERRSEFARLREEKLLLDLLDVADSFSAAEQFNQDGFSQIYKQFIDLLKRYGVSAIDTSIGKKFDPLYHEAIGQIETEQADEDEMIVEELQR